MEKISNSQKIAQNTLFLYLRMIITMGVSLYTSRVILDALGAEDYGIYGIVGSVVVLFSFLQNAMVGASQRFFSFEIGKGKEGNISRIFSTTLLTYAVVAIFAFVLGESIGLWVIQEKLVIPESRIFAANVVYQLSLLSFIITIFQIPYNALIVSYEKMTIYAYVSIVDVVLKLVVAFSVILIPYDRLIVYGLMILAVNFISFSIYFLYCKRAFVECCFKFEPDISQINQLLSFTGWSLCGNIANVAAQQGGNIILNLFFGVLVNTAYGIANQVSGAIFAFVTNFQMAFRPQIVKLYSSGDFCNMQQLMFRSSRFSFYLLLIIAIPFIVNADYIFQLWLKEVPVYSVVFCQIMMCYCLIDAIQAPLWMMIDASGRIKTYSIWLSLILVFNLPLSYVLLKYGYPPETLLLVRVILNLITAFIRTIYVKYAFDFPSYEYIKQIAPAIMLAIITFVIAFEIKKRIGDYYCNEVISICLNVIIVLLIIIFIGMNKSERLFLKKIILKK